MATLKYVPISQPGTTFNQPRQKQYAIMKTGDYGWSLDTTSGSFERVRSRAKELLDKGGEFTSLSKIMVVEIIPIDSVITPNV